MSETLEHTEETGGAPPPPETHVDDVEARARRMGWKPAEELRRAPPGGALSPQQFLDRAETELPLARERLRNLDTQVVQLNQKLDEYGRVINDLTDLNRKAEDRAYKRAVRELNERRDAAVANADVATVRAIDAEMEEVRQTAPAQPSTKPAATATEPKPAIDPDAAAWVQDNDWFLKHSDLALEAQELHQTILRTRPRLTVRENLDMVAERIRKLYPERFENPRRNAPAAVAPAAAGSPRRSNGRDFDGLPADSKTAYERYAKTMKGKPLTKEEWAKSYYDDEG